MKSVILYSLPPGSGFCGPYWTVFPSNGPEDWGIPIRAEVVDGDILEALDKATPGPGETVLNIIPYVATE